MSGDDHSGRSAAPPAHSVGEPLGGLSLHELTERIALLQGEIERLEREREARRAAADAASSVFGGSAKVG